MAYNMRIPNAPDSEDAANYDSRDLESSTLQSLGFEESTWTPRSHREHEEPYATRGSLEDASNEASGKREQEEDHILAERARYCPSGKVFYSCANGFRGCCSHDPCNPGGTCHVRPRSSHSKERTKTATHTHKSTAHVTTSPTQSHAQQPPDATHGTEQHSTSKDPKDSSDHSTAPFTTSTSTGSSSESTSTSTSSGPVVSGSPPACPAGNGTNYMDSANEEYTIYCGMENGFVTYNGVWVDNGGYGACFSYCSQTDECAGFTFHGSVSGSGDCYQKIQMPGDQYITHDGDKWVTAAKVDAPDNTGTGQSTTPKKAGIIAGSVFGSILLVVLILLFIYCCAKRQRRKVDERRATITHVIQGPIEMQPYKPPDHQRHGSTSHDFGQQPNGGAAPRNITMPAKTIGQVGPATPPGLYGLEQTLREESKGEIRPESGAIPILLPSTTYQPAGGTARRDFAQQTTRAGSRLQRIQKQLNEQRSGQTQRSTSTMDSPTLGQRGYDTSMANDIRRHQHLANATPPRNTPSPKTSSPVSPSRRNEQRDYGFEPSPTYGGNRWREV